MIKLKIGSNTKRTDVIVDADKTLAQSFADQSIDTSTAIVYLNGSTIEPADMNRSFSDLGITDAATLIAVVKLDNA